MVAKKMVLSAIAKMDQTTTRTIDDGSGTCGTFQLSDAIADNVTQWINEEYDEDTYEWTESDIVAYIDATYPKEISNPYQS